MNITFGAAAISARGRDLLPAVWASALSIGTEAYGLEDMALEVTDRRVLMNARAVAGTWNAPTWLEDEHGHLSLSQPPVSVTQEVPRRDWERWALGALREDGGRRTVQPGYFGITLWRDGGFEAWNDLFGFGRAYYVRNDDFVAVGTHIGMVSQFASAPLEADVYGADVLSQVGFWPEDRSPIASVRRLGASEVITVGRHDEVTVRRYSEDAEHFGYRETEPDVQAVAESMAILTANGGEIAVQDPIVHLSGGQDSRVTAAAWIAGGKSGRLQTVGTLQGEVDIAEKLVAALEAERPMSERGLEHTVTYPNPGRIAQFSIEDRLAQGLLQWDGDFAPGNLKAAIRRPPARSRLTIGGANGEVMHGIYYATPEILALVRKLEHPVDRVAKAFAGRGNTESSRRSMLEFLEHQKEFTSALGHHDATALNVFQMTSKFRRWINAQLNSTSLVLLLNPVFVRACLDLTPQQRLDKVMQKALSRALIPAWEQVGYYKATLAEATSTNKARGIRTWDTSPGSMERLLHERTQWQQWFTPEFMTSIEETVAAGEGNSAHESALNKAYVLDAIPDHVVGLERRRRAAWQGAA